MRRYMVKAFTKNREYGNGAGVVLDADDLSEVEMQRIAGEIGLSETAFIGRSRYADFKLRFFTPIAEVPLCGHATVAAFTLLKSLGIIGDGEYIQETQSGMLGIRVDGDEIFMEQCPPEFYQEITDEEVLNSLGISKGDIHPSFPMQIVSTGLKDLLIPLKDREVLKRVKGDMKKIKEISKGYDIVGYHLFALSKEEGIDAHCRNFAPLYGIDEEAATGTSNGALAAYLYKRGIKKEGENLFHFCQGEEMESPCTIKAKLNISKDEIEGCFVGGSAVLI